MFALAPGAIRVVARERDFDADVSKLPHQRFRLGEVAADIDFLLLEEKQEPGDEIAFGNTPNILLTCLAISAGNGDGDQTAREVSAAQEIHDGAANAGGVDDERGGRRVQLRARDQTADVLDDGRVV